jgi:hypothetical protein
MTAYLNNLDSLVNLSILPFRDGTFLFFLAKKQKNHLLCQRNPNLYTTSCGYYL